MQVTLLLFPARLSINQTICHDAGRRAVQAGITCRRVFLGLLLGSLMGARLMLLLLLGFLVTMLLCMPLLPAFVI